MFYPDVRKTSSPRRTAERLLQLRALFEAEKVPVKKPDTLLLATWNIREFDAATYGERSLECLYYIAEICSRFDLIAIQEVREDLKALERLRDILGSPWTYIVSDVTEGKAGNRERMAFLFDSGRVRFNSMAGEVVLPPMEIKQGNKTVRRDPSEQLFRTPYLVGFRAGWTSLMLCTVHIAYGEAVKDDPVRVKEIDGIAKFLAARSREKSNNYSNLVLLGDFNIFGRGDVTMQAITKAGFEVPKELQTVPQTNVGAEGRHYDQIAFMPEKYRLETTGNAGVLDYYMVLYRPEDEALYVPDMGKAYTVNSKGVERTEKQRTTYYKGWRTYQMSDHLPMWIELRTDFADSYLKELVKTATLTDAPPAPPEVPPQ